MEFTIPLTNLKKQKIIHRNLIPPYEEFQPVSFQRWLNSLKNSGNIIFSISKIQFNRKK